MAVRLNAGRIAALLFATLLASPALADEAFDACLRSAGPQETRCGKEWVAREQQNLDAAWQRLMEVADGGLADTLNTEQQAWLAFRDVSCSFKQDEGFGGAAGPTGFHACRAEVIAARVKALDGYTRYIDN
jgi:uncharacterized protein YecT (DUF1311 family)